MKSCLVVLSFFISATVYALALNDDVTSGPSSELSACSEIPTVEKAQPSATMLKSNYTKGDSLVYHCQKGYVGRIIFICDGDKWKNSRNSECSRKGCGLPEDIPNGRFMLINGTNFVYGSTIKYICKPGYQMASLVDTRACSAEGWTNHLPVCEEIVCSPPVVKENVIVDGLPDDDNPLTNGHYLKFTCKSRGFKLVGPEEVMCDENGEWSNAFPSCEEVTCKEGQLRSVKIVKGVPGVVAPFKPKHSLTFQCDHSHWIMNGPSMITCKEDGTWSSPYPTCSVKSGCGPPPLIEFADITTLQKPYYYIGEQVEYKCQKFYTMSGQSFMTCTNGNWNGFMTCLKPCIVSIAKMDAHNIKPYYGAMKNMFSPHDDKITFTCQKRRQSISPASEFRQQCKDGFMKLPSCL